MRFSSYLRVLFALFVSVSALGSALLSPMGAAAQSGNGFVMDAMRTCSNGLQIRWDEAHVEKIEFSATDTSLNWTTGWIEVVDFEDKRHFEQVGQPFDKVNVRATFFDGSTTELDANVGICTDKSNAPWPSLDAMSEPTPGSGGGHSGPQPVDGSYTDAATGNSFSFDTAMRMCADNSLVTTFSGDNLQDVSFLIYNPSPGWGTEWLPADLDSGSFTTAIEREGAYYVDAAINFVNGDSVMVNVYLVDCTTEQTDDDADEIPDAGIGENQLVLTLSVPGDADISGAPYNVYAPEAAMQAVGPLASGVVGANNTITVNDLIPGQYRIVVSPEGMDPIEAVVTVGDQPVTRATVTVNADGTTTVAYAAQDVPVPTGEPAATNESASGSTSSGESSGDVTGLPSTGAGSSGSSGVMLAALMAAAIVLTAVPARVAWGNRLK